jgi:hypothetical protein
MRDAVSDSIVDDGHEQGVWPEGSGHQECHISVAGGGFGGECGDVAFPMVAGPEEVGGNDDGGCPSGDARVEGGADRWFREFHVRGFDDGVPAAQLPFRDEVLVASV